MSRACSIVVVLGALGAPGLASGQLYGEASDSPRSHAVGIKFGPYTPDIGSEGVNAYEWSFAGDAMFMFRLEYEYQLWKEAGTFALGVEWGYATIDGKGVAANNADNVATEDETTLHMFPFVLSVIYNFDLLAVRFGVPLVPYVKAGFDYNLWWVTDGLGDVATFLSDDKTTEYSAAGGTFGWHVQVGLKLLLDVFAPNMAKSFDNEVGVNNSYLFAEMLYADIDDFDSDTSWQLGSLTAMFGLSFEL